MPSNVCVESGGDDQERDACDDALRCLGDSSPQPAGKYRYWCVIIQGLKLDDPTYIMRAMKDMNVLCQIAIGSRLYCLAD